MTFTTLIYTFMRGQSTCDKMSIQRFTDIHMSITPTIAQKPCNAYFNIVFLVLYPMSRVIDSPWILFLDLNDIAWNFSNCLDLICTSLMGTLEIPRHFQQRAHYAALLSKLGGTAAVPWFLFLFIFVSPSCQKPSQLIYHPLSLFKLDFTTGKQR